MTTVPAEAAELETRGTLQIDHLVVRKIAEHTVDADRSTTTVTRTLGADRGASVRVGGTGDQVDLTLDMGMDYPADLRAAVRTVRATVSDEIHRLTGYRVRSIDVTISALRTGGTQARVR